MFLCFTLITQESTFLDNRQNKGKGNKETQYVQVGKETTKKGPCLLFLLFLQEGGRAEERVLIGGKANEGRTMRI